MPPQTPKHIITFKLPNFLDEWPYECRLHPAFGVVDAESKQWVNEYQFFGEKSQKVYDAGRFGLLGSLACPLRSEEFLRVACMFSHMLFLLDEYNEVADPGMAGQLYHIVMEAMHHPYKELDKRNKLGNFVQGCENRFWQQALVLTTLDAAIKSDFVDVFDEYMKSMAEEAHDREAGRVRSVEDYIRFRRVTNGASATAALLRFGLTIPEEVLSHPVIESMTLAFVDLVWIINDMHSFAGEFIPTKTVHNIVAIVMAEHDMDVPSAMAWNNNFAKFRVSEFLSNFKRLPSWGQAIDDEVQLYLDSMGYLIRAVDAWSFETGRYWGKRGKEIQRTRVVTLDPDMEPRKALLTKQEVERYIAEASSSAKVRL
ncbi:hypothetical protein NP233_g11858 [Leucocoprinus birnbaumii]|uniref:Terpene synthase n=1 Tax=Leucocoprinus birnbaumii TaxID=56174 RepID=A0AAD5VFQ9_9AGAR|nr:hypothetical protein NP233_g11858 [Leucocoprinus birnbaumii]